MSEIAFIAAEQFNSCWEMREEESLSPSEETAFNFNSELHVLAEEVRELREMMESKFSSLSEDINLVRETVALKPVSTLAGLTKTLANDVRHLKTAINNRNGDKIQRHQLLEGQDDTRPKRTI